ncbi:MAG: GNAT family N-acetyltransferase [Bacteroidales bacterium]|jgi:predicted GNAT family N-acyltransferase|nr:GNAT family N-acetyltransferase [Bacteroidales bacterium]
MKLVRLTSDYDVHEFDCGDSDLNDFLLRDAKHFLAKHIANTFILEEDGRVAGYFCLLNDKISRLEIVNSQWKKIRDSFPDGKKFRSYPTVKIGRFAIALDYRGRNLGTELMILIKQLLSREQNYSAFRFLTVDAYLSAVEFYRKNGFKELTKKDEDEHTRLMFFDMMNVE